MIVALESANIAAGIVTFEPDLHRLRENLASIASQVNEVAVFDNGSNSATSIEEIVAAFHNATLISSTKNVGIATALNQLAHWAIESGYKKIVTLDQDSVAPNGMVAALAAIATTTGAAIVTPYIVDRNKLSVEDYERINLPIADDYTQAARKGAITSGALTDLSVLREVGGFDDRFFIDYVDYDFNQRVLLAGHRIVRANRTYLLHEVGRAERTWLTVPRRDVDGTWKAERFFSFGHSSERCYYKARNRVLFTRKYWRKVGLTNEGVWQIPQQVALTLLFETGRRDKLRSFLRGIRDGLALRL